ncbi:tyrosine-type recombinase/integrase [Mesorhizobium sp. M0060]|uniref:tyrosine-type recombinase/integrase n=1 Tax=Mesorhizobium sp. M0060 TaxID=2956866 RepID=UPI0033373035
MIQRHVNRYIQLHRALGKKFDAQEQALSQFAALASERAATIITAELILEWVREAATPNAARIRFGLARAFAEFLHGEDPRHEVPTAGLMGRGRRRRPAPYILMPDQIASIMAEALKVPGLAPISPLTYHHLFGLLASTGLRISEAISLRCDDLTDDGLMVRSGKFGKSRLVPLHASTRTALEQYLAVRREFGGASDIFLCSVTVMPRPRPEPMWSSSGLSDSSGTATRQGRVPGCTICATPSQCDLWKPAGMIRKLFCDTCVH